MSISMALGYMPWYNFSAVLKYISEEYHLTSTDTGLILSAFQAGYVLVVVCVGWLADRMSLKKILFFATLSTGISSTIFIWGSQGKLSILVFRLITGISAGAIYIPGLALLAKWFPSDKRGTALGVYNAALVMAYAGGYLVASHVSVSHGWRSGIFWTSIPVFVAALVIHLFVRDLTPDEERAAFASVAVDSCRGKTVETGTAGNCILDDGRGEGLVAPAGGYAGPALISTGYMGHMWELYAFWGWIGPFVLSSLLCNGKPADVAVEW
jgi:MFS family permease